MMHESTRQARSCHSSVKGKQWLATRDNRFVQVTLIRVLLLPLGGCWARRSQALVESTEAINSIDTEVATSSQLDPR